MNKTLQDEDGLPVDSPKSVAVPAQRPTTAQDSSETEQTAEMSDEEVMPAKRSSVVDMWRKREGSINRGAAVERASPVTNTAPRKLQARTGASPVSAKPATPVLGEEGGDNLDNNAEVYSFDEKKDQAFEETEQTSEIEEESELVPSNHTILNPVSSGPVDMTYLPARESPMRSHSPANSWSKRIVQQAGAALPSPSHHESPVGENHHEAQDTQDTNTPKPSSVKNVWAKRSGGEGSFPFNQPQRGDSLRRPKDAPLLPGTPNAGAKPHPVADLPLMNQGSSLVAGDSPKVAGSSSRTSVRNRWLQRENSDSGRQAGCSSEKDEVEEELELINGGISTGGVPTTPRSEVAPLTPRTPGGSVADRWTKRISPGNNNIPSSPVILPSLGTRSDMACKSSPFGDVRAQWAKRGSGRDLGKEHLPALSIPNMKEEEEQERVNTVEISRNSESTGVPSPRLSMGKLWAKRHTTTESQTNEESVRDNAGTDGYGAPTRKQNPPSSDSRLNSASPNAGVRKGVLGSPSSQLRRDVLAKRKSRAAVATRESSNSGSDVAPRDDRLGSAPNPVPSAASINPKIPITSPRSASNKRIEISNDGTAASPQAGALNRKMQLKKLGQKHSARPKPGIDSVAEDQQIRENTERSAPARVSGPASRDKGANILPAPLSAVNQKRSNRNLQIQTKQQSVQAVKASPVAARKTSGVVIPPKMVASQRVSPLNAPDRDTKQVLLDKHRQRVNKPGLVPDTITDDNSADAQSETLSQTFHDIIAEVDQNQRSKQVSSAAQRHPKKTGAPAKPFLNVRTLLAFGSEEDKTFDDSANLPGADYVGDSCSFDLPYTSSRSSMDASKHNHEMGSDAGASRSSAGANSLAARATRMMRAKHQSKTDERQAHPNDVTETTRRPLVVDQATMKAGHRSHAKPTEIKPYEQEHHTLVQPKIERQTGVSPRSSAYENQSRFVDSLPSDSSTVTHTTGPSDGAPTFSFATETDESNGASASVSEVDSSPDKGERRRTTPRAGRLDIIADEFVAESNFNTDAFKSAYQSLSLEQIANDLKEGVAGTLYIPGLDFSKLSRDLNKGMSAATESLSKFVGNEAQSPSKKGQLKIPIPKETVPAEERVAIEVEYVEDSDSE